MRTTEERKAEMVWILGKMPEPHEDVVGAVVVFLYDDGAAMGEAACPTGDPEVREAAKEMLRKMLLAVSAGATGDWNEVDLKKGEVH